MSGDKKARRGMTTYVALIFVIGIIVAGAYVLVLKPGETSDQPAIEAVNPNG